MAVERVTAVHVASCVIWILDLLVAADLDHVLARELDIAGPDAPPVAPEDAELLEVEVDGVRPPASTP